MEAGESAGQQGTRMRKRAEDHRAQAAESARRADATDHQADLWERGQVGEQTVGAALERLRELGYDVLHDVRWPGRRRANIDHVAIGPAGILVVDAKNWSGAVTTHRGRLRQNGHPRDKELEGVLRAGVDVAALLPPASVPRVIPVLCLAGEHEVAPTLCAEVTVVDVSRLTDWVSGLPLRLTPAEVLDLTGVLRRGLPPASSPMPRQIMQRRKAEPANELTLLPTKSRLRRCRLRRCRLRRLPVAPLPVAPVEWSIASKKTMGARSRVFAKIALLLAALLVLPAVAFWWSSNGSEVVSSIFPAAAPTVAAAVAPVVPAFGSCRALRAGHPGGIASPGAKNTGRKLRRAVVVTTSQSLYAANARLDSDRDRIACEVVRKRHHKR